MKKTTLILIVVVFLVLVGAGLGYYFYTKKKKKTPESNKKLMDDMQAAPQGKPYDSQFKAVATQFFTDSGLTAEQQGSLLEDMQNRFLQQSNGSTVDAFIAAVSNWMPAWEADSNFTDEQKTKIKNAWAALYKKWSELKAQAILK